MAHRLHRLLQIAVIIAATLVTPAWAQIDARVVDQEVTAAVRSVAQGRIQEWIDRLDTLFRKIRLCQGQARVLAYWFDALRDFEIDGGLFARPSSVEGTSVKQST